MEKLKIVFSSLCFEIPCTFAMNEKKINVMEITHNLSWDFTFRFWKFHAFSFFPFTFQDVNNFPESFFHNHVPVESRWMLERKRTISSQCHTHTIEPFQVSTAFPLFQFSFVQVWMSFLLIIHLKECFFSSVLRRSSIRLGRWSFSPSKIAWKKSHLM